MFDLRKPEPLVVKDHLYDAAIVDLKFHCAAGDHTGRQRIVSADSHIVKVRLTLRSSAPPARSCTHCAHVHTVLCCTRRPWRACWFGLRIHDFSVCPQCIISARPPKYG